MAQTKCSISPLAGYVFAYILRFQKSLTRWAFEESFRTQEGSFFKNMVNDGFHHHFRSQKNQNPALHLQSCGRRKCYPLFSSDRRLGGIRPNFGNLHVSYTINHCRVWKGSKRKDSMESFASAYLFSKKENPSRGHTDVRVEVRFFDDVWKFDTFAFFANCCISLFRCWSIRSV